MLARTRAHADQANAERQAQSAAAEVAELRAELAQVRSDAHAEASRLRQETRDDREALRPNTPSNSPRFNATPTNAPTP